MRRETTAERAAWTAHIEGASAPVPSKYRNEKCDGYDSKREAGEASKLAALAACGQIKNLREQVPFTLVEKNGKLRAIKYIADFVYEDLHGTVHVCDAKGFTKNPVYRLKKRLMLEKGITIEEL